MSVCATVTADRRRTFWTTQPSACGEVPGCVSDCGTPGLQFTQSRCGSLSCQCCPAATENPDCISQQSPLSSIPRSIVTTDWVRSLVLNILGTDGKVPNNSCGHAPGAQGGHWSESYRADGQLVGNLLRTVPSGVSILKSIALIKAQLTSDLARLIVMNVAQSVSVETAYAGGNVMVATVTIVAPNGTNVRVGLSGKRNTNSWMWS